MDDDTVVTVNQSKIPEKAGNNEPVDTKKIKENWIKQLVIGTKHVYGFEAEEIKEADKK